MIKSILYLTTDAEPNRQGGRDQTLLPLWYFFYRHFPLNTACFLQDWPNVRCFRRQEILQDIISLLAKENNVFDSPILRLSHHVSTIRKKLTMLNFCSSQRSKTDHLQPAGRDLLYIVGLSFHLKLPRLWNLDMILQR